MPKQAFQEMWETIERGNEWNGCVKNLRKDGAFYWVHVFISPKFDPNGNKIGYIAGRKVADPEVLKKAKLHYKQLLEEEQASLAVQV